VDVAASGDAELEFTILEITKSPDAIVVRGVFPLDIIGCVLKGIVFNCVGVVAEFYGYAA